MRERLGETMKRRGRYTRLTVGKELSRSGRGDGKNDGVGKEEEEEEEEVQNKLKLRNVI